MILRILIVDDEPLARERLRLLLQEEPQIEIIGEVGDGKNAVRAIRRNRPDLVLLDIQLPEMAGFEIVASLDPEHMPAIVFVTAYEQFAVRAFKIHAVDYLLKPVEPARLHEALTRVRKLNSEEGDIRQRVLDLMQDVGRRRGAQDRIAVKTDGDVVILKLAEIDWAESAGSYVCFHTAGQTHISRQTMQQAEQDLLRHNFIRIHRSTIVNLDRVKKLKSLPFGEYAVELRDGTTLPISRGYKDEALRALGYA